jgi:hypothetical protein
MKIIPILLFAIITNVSHAVEFVYPNKVELIRRGSVIRIVNQRNNQELSISARNVVAVVPADRNDNNSYTLILTKGAVIKLQQRTNPADDIVNILGDMGFEYIRAISDRDNRDADIYLVNAKNVDLIDRTRTDSDRSDTTIYFNADIGGSPGKFAINQSASAYKDFIARIESVRY